MSKVKSETQMKLAEIRMSVAGQKAEMKALNSLRKNEREAEKAEKITNQATKRAVSIQKAEARLEKLRNQANPVGSKAIKASKKPGKVTVT